MISRAIFKGLNDLRSGVGSGWNAGRGRAPAAGRSKDRRRLSLDETLPPGQPTREHGAGSAREDAGWKWIEAETGAHKIELSLSSERPCETAGWRGRPNPLSGLESSAGSYGSQCREHEILVKNSGQMNLSGHWPGRCPERDRSASAPGLFDHKWAFP